MLMQIRGILSTMHLLDIIDIVIVAVVLYKLYYTIKDTRAVSLLKGLVVLLVMTLISKWLGLNVVNWLLQKSATVILVALPIVFQPELRRALEQLGRGGLFRKNIFLDAQETQRFVDELVKSAIALSRNKIGALMVIEREIGLNEYMDQGIKIDGIVSAEFMINIFIPNTPLHDGASIIRGNRVMAAGCVLPLTEDSSLNKELGTRHRAALGISEQTDAVVLVVSEETGVISLARGGQLLRYLDAEGLRKQLLSLFLIKQIGLSELLRWRPMK